MGWNFSQLSPQLQRRIVADGLPFPNKLGQPAQNMVRKIKGEMNKSETDFHFEWLQHQNFDEIQYESLKLNLGYRLTYTPDFYCQKVPHKPAIYEVKAPHRFRDKGIVKLKVAATQYPQYDFFLVEKKNKQWLIKPIPSVQLRDPQISSFPTEEDED